MAMSFLSSSLLCDDSDSVVTEDLFGQELQALDDDSFSDAPLACPPLDHDYLLSSTNDHLIALTCRDLDDKSPFFDGVKKPDRKPKPMHGKGKSMRLLKKVLLNEDTCPNQNDGKKIIKKKAEVLSTKRCVDEETHWQAKLESARQRFRQRYQAEHKKRKTIKILDPKDCPKLLFSHR